MSERSSRGDVEHVARLARLELTDDEKAMTRAAFEQCGLRV